MTREEMYIEMIKETDELIEAYIQIREKMKKQLEDLRMGPISVLQEDVGEQKTSFEYKI